MHYGLHAFNVVCSPFSKIIFSKNYFKNTVTASNGLNPDQDQSTIGPDLGPNCLLRLSRALEKPAYHVNYKKKLIGYVFIKFLCISCKKNKISFMSFMFFQSVMSRNVVFSLLVYTFNLGKS